MTPQEIKNLPLAEKTAYFKGLLSNLDNDNEVDILNVFRLVNSYNMFDDDFFAQEASYISDISEFIDVKAGLEEEIKEFYKQAVTWYLSIIASCEVPVTVDQDDTKDKIPATLYGFFLIGSLPLMASIMGKINLGEIDMTKLYKVQEGFAVLAKLFQNHALVGEFLEKL